MLIQMVHDDDIKQIQQNFQNIDTDHNGFLDVEELK